MDSVAYLGAMLPLIVENTWNNLYVFKERNLRKSETLLLRKQIKKNYQLDYN